MTTTPDLHTVVQDVEWRLAEVFRRDLGVTDPDALAARGAAALADEGPSSTTAAALLRDSGVRDAWNRVFADERSKEVAAAVRPFLRGRVLDLLAGDANVARRLVESGVTDVECWERVGAYPYEAALPMRPFDELISSGATADTVLMCTVLHHEQSAPALLDTAARLGAKQWVVVENCVGPTVGKQVHEFMDIFFNTCLNQFDVDCTTEHRTMEGWCDLLSSYGEVTHTADLGRIPGMPFPYELIVVRTDV